MPSGYMPGEEYPERGPYKPGEEYRLPPYTYEPADGEPERPKRDDPEDWLSSRMFRIRKAAWGEWRMRGELEPWQTYLEANYPDVAGYYARKTWKKYGEKEPWETWFARRYPSLAEKYGREPVTYVAGKGYMPVSKVEKLKRMGVTEPEDETWADWLRGAARYTPKVKTVEF